MDVAYSIASQLKSGIGYTASNAVHAIKEKGWLKQLFTLKEIPVDEGAWKDYAFDNIASIKLDTMDIFHGWCNMSYSQILKAHSFGAKTVIERASSHVLDQYRVMVEEYKRFGIKPDPIHPYSIRKQLNEYEMSDYIATPSEQSKQSLLDHSIDEEKILHLPYGVDTEKFVPKPVEHDKFTAIFVGQNWIRKNLYRVEKAWSTLNLKNSKLLVRCDASVFSDISYVGIKRLKWVGDMQEFYNSCDIMIMPSLEEGRCLVVLEAMASGIPVIISKNIGVEITDGKEGFYVDPYNIKSIQDKISYFYDNREESRRCGKAARRMAERCTWDDYKKKLVSSYQKIVE